MPPTYSLVVPIFNEEAVIPVLLRRLDAMLETLDAEAEVILVDDGSKDTGAIVIEAKARADKRYRLIKLSRNFGHQIAITVGLDHATGRAVIVMDGDLQDPPEVVLQMIAKWKEGYHVVSAERVSRQGESWFKRASANLFYRLMGRLGGVPQSRNTGDFRLVDRRALDCFLAMPERDRFVRGMFAWIGFRQGTVTFDRRPRAAGDSKYSLRKMVALAANGIISFSDAPLRLALWAGAAVSALAFLYGLSVIGRWVLGDPSLERGWSSTIVVIATLGGANMLMTGVIGLYVGRIYAEAKGRPLYIVEREVGFEDASTAARPQTPTGREQVGTGLLSGARKPKQ
jgi:polyisoprenyl-phosphate glycosyltransferase